MNVVKRMLAIWTTRLFQIGYAIACITVIVMQFAGASSLGKLSSSSSSELFLTTQIEEIVRLEIEYGNLLQAILSLRNEQSPKATMETVYAFNRISTRIQNFYNRGHASTIQLAGMTSDELSRLKNNIDKMKPELALAIRGDVAAQEAVRDTVRGEIALVSRLSKNARNVQREELVRMAKEQRLISSEVAHQQFLGLISFAALVFLILWDNYLQRRAHLAIAAREKQIQHAATHDYLTGLANRAALASFPRHNPGSEQIFTDGTQIQLLYIDIDNFKPVNDRHGHAAGDMVLQYLAERISEIAPANAIISRIGGDEFVMIMVGDDDAGNEMARNIIDIATQPVPFANSSLVVGTSVGITSASLSESFSLDTHLKEADVALYRAKSDGPNRHCRFKDAVKLEYLRTSSIEAELGNAIDHDDLDLVWQPIYRLSEQRTVGVEALARWTCEPWGAVPPSEFVRFAERMGLGPKLDLYVIGRALREANALGLPDHGIAVSINIGAQRIADRAFLDRAIKLIKNAGFGTPTNPVNLEVTEDSLPHDLDVAVLNLARLRMSGIGVAIDDFGTGYSNFRYLFNDHFSSVKIDRTLVKAASDSPRSGDIVRSLVTMGASAKLKVVAEGIETDDELELLAGMGVDYVQGYLIAAPMPGRDLTRRLSKEKTAGAKLDVPSLEDRTLHA
jgi:diguanylate cyclase (GGDEF)-like protein